MTSIPASSVHSARSGSTRSRPMSVSDSPLATSSNASSEPSVNNNLMCLDSIDIDDELCSVRAGPYGRWFTYLEKKSIKAWFWWNYLDAEYLERQGRSSPRRSEYPSSLIILLYVGSLNVQYLYPVHLCVLSCAAPCAISTRTFICYWKCPLCDKFLEHCTILDMHCASWFHPGSGTCPTGWNFLYALRNFVAACLKVQLQQNE